MLDTEQKQKRDPSSLIGFILLSLIAVYLVYLVTTIPFEIGRIEGQIKASYVTGTEQEDSGEEEVFNHRELVQPNQELISLGSQIYTTNCASCHGSEGYGDGTAGQRLSVKPRSFHEREGWKNGTSAVTMYETLQNGVAPAMPAFKASLNPRQKYAVIHYIHDEFMSDVGWEENTEQQLASLPEPSAAVDISIDPYTQERVPIRYAMLKLSEDGDEEQVSPKKHAPSAGFGKDLYMMNCAACHGPNGEGVKPPEVRTMTQLRQLAWGSSLLKDDAAWAGDYDTFSTIVEKGQPNGIKPPFATLTEQEMRALWNYAKDLREDAEE